MIIYATDSKQISWPKSDSHDPDSEKYYQIDYYPSTRANAAAYTQAVDVVVLSAPNGCMYECISGGISGSDESVINTAENTTSTDGDVTWFTKALTTLLGPGDSITASEWASADTGVTLSDEGIIHGIATEVKVSTVPASLTTFSITNTITVLYATGREEIRQRTLNITVKEL